MESLEFKNYKDPKCHLVIYALAVAINLNFLFNIFKQRQFIFAYLLPMIRNS